MRYCFSCRRLTAGAPLFCSHCGNTYDVRLCPRLHVSPRTARVCSQCGSHDLSTPQPRRSLISHAAYALLARLPGIVLLLLSIWLLLAFVSQLLTNQQVQAELFALLLMLGVGWWAYTQLPAPIRQGVSRLVRRRRHNGRQ